VSTTIKEVLDGIEYFADELSYSLRAAKKSNPTKKMIIEYLDHWINTIETIKSITKENGIK
jgi:hypothetical protein